MVDLKTLDVVDGIWEPVVGAISAFLVFTLVAQVLRVTVPAVSLIQVALSR